MSWQCGINLQSALAPSSSGLEASVLDTVPREEPREEPRAAIQSMGWERPALDSEVGSGCSVVWV